jgi:hypothetical protein
VKRTFVAVLLLTSSAHADDVCLSSHADAQLLRKKHSLSAAAKSLRLCAQQSCPSLVQKDCIRWLSEVEAEQPTVIIVATDEDGKETLAVRVLLDGKPLVDKLDGSPIAIDPGEHVLRFERPSGLREERIVLHDGEKSRTVKVSFAAPAKKVDEPAPPPPSAGIPASTWVFGAIGVAALGSFGYFGLSGRSKESSLSSSCAPRCSDDDIAPVKRSYLVADISLGVSVASFAIATVLAVTNKSPEPAKTAVDVRAIAGGAFASVVTSF